MNSSKLSVRNTFFHVSINFLTIGPDATFDGSPVATLAGMGVPCACLPLRTGPTPRMPATADDGPAPDLLHFPVPWRPIFRATFYCTTLAVYALLLLALGVGYITHDFDLKAAFPELSLELAAATAVGTPLLTGAMALLASFMLSRASVTLTSTHIHGADHRTFRTKIPLNAITSVKFFNDSGIRAIVLCTKKHGDLYISSKTERIAELLAFLQPFLPKYTADIRQLLAFCNAPDDGLLSLTPDRMITLRTPQQLARLQRQREKQR